MEGFIYSYKKQVLTVSNKTGKALITEVIEEEVMLEDRLAELQENGYYPLVKQLENPAKIVAKVTKVAI